MGDGANGNEGACAANLSHVSGVDCDNCSCHTSLRRVVGLREWRGPCQRLRKRGLNQHFRSMN